MKKIIFSSIAAILLIFIFVNWQKPPVEYVVITKANSITKYWSNERKMWVITGSLQEALNQLSFYGYKFEAITASQAMSSSGGYNFTETIIMAK